MEENNTKNGAAFNVSEHRDGKAMEESDGVGVPHHDQLRDGKAMEESDGVGVPHHDQLPEVSDVVQAERAEDPTQSHASSDESQTDEGQNPDRPEENLNINARIVALQNPPPHLILPNPPRLEALEEGPIDEIQWMVEAEYADALGRVPFQEIPKHPVPWASRPPVVEPPFEPRALMPLSRHPMIVEVGFVNVERERRHTRMWKDIPSATCWSLSGHQQAVVAETSRFQSL